MVLRLFLLLLPLLTSTAAAQEVVRITEPEARNPNEVSVAINPADPDNIVAVAMQYGKKPRISNYSYVSHDGGNTWQTVAMLNPQGRTQGDDAVTFDAEGHAYRTYISFDGIRVKRPKVARTGIFVSRSDDGGVTWSTPVPAVDHINTVLPFEDKPWIATDRSVASEHYGTVYLAWTRFDEYGSDDPADSTQIFFTRSVDGGETFDMPYRISDSGGDARDSDDTVEGAVPSVGPDGTVYVVWAGPRGLVFDRSDDGGVTFGTDRVIAQNPGGWDTDTDGIGRTNGMPVTGVDRSDGPFKGSLYVNWIDARNGDQDVFVMSTRDGGTTWSEPMRVNDDAVGNGKEQFFTWMAVDPADGSINVVFYDRRDLDGGYTGVTLARSVDGGATFVNHRVPIDPFETNERIFFGDYVNVDAQGGLVVPVFMHFTDGEHLALSIARYRFKPGTQQLIDSE